MSNKRAIVLDISDSASTRCGMVNENVSEAERHSIDECHTDDKPNDVTCSLSKQSISSRKLRKTFHDNDNLSSLANSNQAHLCWMDVQHLVESAEKDVIVQKLAKTLFETVWNECGEQSATAVLNTFLEHYAINYTNMTEDQANAPEGTCAQEILVESDSEGSDDCDSSRLDEKDEENLRFSDEETIREPASSSMEGTWNLEVQDYCYNVDTDYFTLHISSNEASLYSLAVHADLTADSEIRSDTDANVQEEVTFKGSTSEWEDSRDDFDVMLRVHHDPEFDTIAGEVDVNPQPDRSAVAGESSRNATGGRFFFTGIRE